MMTNVTRSLVCSECGQNLDDLLNSASEEQGPCPNCGSTARMVRLGVDETLTMCDHVAALGTAEGRAAAYRESARDGRVASADQGADGSLSYSIAGSSPQGEEDTLAACRVLVEALNASGGSWTGLRQGQGVVDCEAIDTDCPDRKLSVQVVRAVVDRCLWEELNRQKRFAVSNVDKRQLVEQMKAAIEQKASNQAIPQTVRQDLTLALDAIRLPVLGFDDVVDAFKAQFGTWVNSLGFEAVWLVGPRATLTWRLA